MIVTRSMKMDLALPNAVPWVDVVQDDRYTRNLAISLLRCGNPWEIPEDTRVVVRYKKADGKGGQYDTLPDGSEAYAVEKNVVTLALAPQVLTAEGPVELTVSLIREDRELSLFPIFLRVCPNVGAKLSASERYTHMTGFVPAPNRAEEGQLLRVSGVGDGGKVRTVDAVEPEQVVVTVPTVQISDLLQTEGNHLRRSFHLGDRIDLGDYSGYRIRRLGIRANPGTAVRFALYEMDDQVMTRIAVLGDAVANSNMEAVLTFENGYHVTGAKTVILAHARTEALHCFVLGEGMTVTDVVQYADGDYVDHTPDAQIPYTEEEMESGEAVVFSMFLRELEFLTEQCLEDYFRSVDRRIGNLEGKTPEVQDSVSWNDLQDKPFYEEVTPEVLREYTALGVFSPQSSYGGAYGRSEEPPGYELVLGETYVVMWDGIAYECEAQDASAMMPGAVALGNLTFFNDGVGTGEPFIIGWIADTAAMYMDVTSQETSHKIGIYHNATVVKKLDAKYLPMDAIDERINKALGVIENGTY